MKTHQAISIIILGLAAINANAHHRHHQTWAKVVDVEPVYRWVDTRVPERQCWIESVAVEVPPRDRVGSTLIGGVIGGAIGNAAGHKHKNRQLSTAVGTMIGMAIGNDISRKHGDRSRIEYRDVERCEVKHVRQRERQLQGYDVVYRYRGALHRTHTKHHPGRRLLIEKHRKHAKRHYGMHRHGH